MDTDRRTFLGALFGSSALVSLGGLGHGSDRNDVYDVKAFGADPTGNEDSSAAFQSALDATPDTGGVVFVPSGQYRIDRTLVWPGVKGASDKLRPTALEGQNRSAVKGVESGWSAGISSIVFTGDGPLFDLRGGGGEPLHFPGSIRRLSLHGRGVPGSTAIDAHHVRSAQFETLVVRRFESGVVVRGESYYSVWDRCVFSDCGKDGLSLRGAVNGTTLHRIRCSSNGRFGLDVRDGDFPVNVADSWFEWNREAGVHATSTIQLAVTGSYFEGNGSASMAFDGYPGTEYTGTVSLVDSYLRPASGGACLVVAGRPVRIRLQGNVVDTKNEPVAVVRSPEGVGHSLFSTGNVLAGRSRIPICDVDTSEFESVVAFGDQLAAGDPGLRGSHVLGGRRQLKVLDRPLLELPTLPTGQRPPPGRPGRIFFNSTEGKLNIDAGPRWVRP